MNKILKSKVAAWCAFAIVIAVLVATYSLRITLGLKIEWWAFTDIFFAFMAAFCHVMAVTLGGINPPAGRKLDMIALVMLILAVIALIGEYIAFSII